MNLNKRCATRIFTLVLCVLLFPSLSSAQIEDGSINLNLEMAMKKNESAKFDGVLVPYPQYRYYQEQVEMSFDREIHPPECDSCIDQVFWSGVSFLSIGLLIGSILASPK